MRRRAFFGSVVALFATPLVVARNLAKPDAPHVFDGGVDTNYVRWRTYGLPSNNPVVYPTKAVESIQFGESFSYIEFEVPLSNISWEYSCSSDAHSHSGIVGLFTRNIGQTFEPYFDYNPNRFRPNKDQRKRISQELRKNPLATKEQLANQL